MATAARRSTRSQSRVSTASASEVDEVSGPKTPGKRAKNAGAGNARNGRKTAAKPVQNGSKMTVNRAIKGRRAPAKDVAQLQPASSDHEIDEIEEADSQQAQEESDNIADSEEDDGEEDRTISLPPPLAGSSRNENIREEPDDEEEGDDDDDDDDGDGDDGPGATRQDGEDTLERLAMFAIAFLARLREKTDYSLSQEELDMLTGYRQRLKKYQGTYPSQSSQDSQVEATLSFRTLIAPRGASQQVVAWTRLVNLLIFHALLCLCYSEMEEQTLGSLGSLMLMHSALLSEFVPRNIRTSPDVLNLWIEMKFQIIMKYRQIQQKQDTDETVNIGSEAGYLEVNEDELEKLFGGHKDAQIAIKNLQKDCKSAWKKLQTKPLDELLVSHPYENFIVRAVEVIDRCTRISKTEMQDEFSAAGKSASPERPAPLKARKSLIPPAIESDDAEPGRTSPAAGPSKPAPASRAGRTARKVSSEFPAIPASDTAVKQSTPNRRSHLVEYESSQSEAEDEGAKSFRMFTVRKKAESERRASEPRRKAQAALSSPIKNKLGDRLLQVLSPIRRGQTAAGSAAADNSLSGHGSNVSDSQERAAAVNALEGTPADEEEGLNLGSDLERALHGQTSEESGEDEDNTVIAATGADDDVFVDINTIIPSEDEDAAEALQTQDPEDDESESQYKQTYDPEEVENALLGSPSQRPFDGPPRSQGTSSICRATDQGRKALEPLSDSDEDEDEDEDNEDDDNGASDGMESLRKKVNGAYRGLAISKDNRIVQRQENVPRASKSMLDRQSDAKRITMSSPSTQTQTQRNSPAASTSFRQNTDQQRRSMSIPVVEVSVKRGKAKGKQRERSATAEPPTAGQQLFQPEPSGDGDDYQPNNFDYGAGDDYPPDEQDDLPEANAQGLELAQQGSVPTSSVRKSDAGKKATKSQPWPTKGAAASTSNVGTEEQARRSLQASTSHSKQKSREKQPAFHDSEEEEAGAGSDVSMDDDLIRQVEAFKAQLKAKKAAAKEASRSASKSQANVRTHQKRRDVEIRPESRDPERVAQKDRHKGQPTKRQEQARQQQVIRRPPSPDEDDNQDEEDDEDEELPVAGPSSRPHVPNKKRQRSGREASDAEAEALRRKRSRSKGNKKRKDKGRQQSDSDEDDDEEGDSAVSQPDSDDERMVDKIWKKHARELLQHRPNDLVPDSDGELKRPKTKIVPPPKKAGLYERKKNGVVVKPKEKYRYSSSAKHGKMYWSAIEDLVLLYAIKKQSDPSYAAILDKYGRYGSKHLAYRTIGNIKDRLRTIQAQREREDLPRLPWYKASRNK